jgi:O-antigen ligase
MLNKSVEQAMSMFLYVGITFATVFLLTGSVTDPVNVTKLAAVGGVGFAVFAIAVIHGRPALRASSKPLGVVFILFVISMLNGMFSAVSPISQNFYGAYGRLTGVLLYILLFMLAIGTSVLRTEVAFIRILKALFIAGAINVGYCAWVLAFGDFVSWSNPYRAILGLFGNPNFISAFLGMFITAVIAYLLIPGKSWLLRVAGSALCFLAFYEIHKSRSIQGKAVTGAGIAIIGFFWIRGKFEKKGPVLLYLASVFVVGSFALAGALQKGPLADFIYKASVSIRGQYWKAAIEAGNQHPFTGIGMDTFGDWYRRTRSEYAASVLPGLNTMTNAAHNVVLDFYAAGGWPLLLTYLASIALGFIAIVKVLVRTKKYDGVFVALAAPWICYQLQSIISINQAGLALWGWVLLGALIAYEYTTRPENLLSGSNGSKAPRAVEKVSVFSPQLIGGLGALIGVLIAVPPLSADMKWTSAVKSGNVQNVEAALVPSYMNPRDSTRLFNAVQLLEQNKFPDLAYKYAKIAVEYNPDFSDAWKILYYLSNATEEDKRLAVANMKRLDPRNPDVLKN